jgi:hypothetical protein
MLLHRLAPLGPIVLAAGLLASTAGRTRLSAQIQPQSTGPPRSGETTRAAGDGASQTTLAWGLDEMEAFLLKAKIIRSSGAGKGVTGSRRVTMSDGRVQHDAHVQTVDLALTLFAAPRAAETNFKDSYRFNIAAYRLARLLDLTNVPPSVPRTIGGKPAAVTWWIDDVLMDEGARRMQDLSGPNPQRTARQLQTVRIFDEIIVNVDRNGGNLLWTSDWTAWMIDHTRAFRLDELPRHPAYLQRTSRELLDRIRALDLDRLKTALGKSLTGPEMAALAKRAAAVVKLYEQRIAERGEAAVFGAEGSADTEGSFTSLSSPRRG